MSKRWSLPLPTIGRAGPRIGLDDTSSLGTKSPGGYRIRACTVSSLGLEDQTDTELSSVRPYKGRVIPGEPSKDLKGNDTFLIESYVKTLKSRPDMFIRKITHREMRNLGVDPRYGGQLLCKLPPNIQYLVLLNSLYYKASHNFRRKLGENLHRGKSGFNTVHQWFYTANAAVLPYLIEGGTSFEVIDRLTKWALESCANNYSVFNKRWKQSKKLFRKAYALRKQYSAPRDMIAYWMCYGKHIKDQHLGLQRVLLWTQSRATGMADTAMCKSSLEKFESVIQLPSTEVKLREEILLDETKFVSFLKPENFKISGGPTACLERTTQNGGKTGFIDTLCRTKSVTHHYNWCTLEPTAVEPHPVRCSSDLLNWAIHKILTEPVKSRTVRVHVVREQSKARVVTIASMAYQILMGVFAHLFQPAMRGQTIKSGLRADRHLWNFVHKDLAPSETLWSHLDSNRTVYALSTDLESATDYGNISVARQIWQHLIIQGSAHHGFPTALALLAKHTFVSNRLVLIPEDLGYRAVVKRRGWFMGDMMTKVILTLAHLYSHRAAGVMVSSIVGDDTVALSNSKPELESILTNLEQMDFKVSEDDTFITDRFMFYCEEAALVPQNVLDSTAYAIKRGLKRLIYIDYPRIRLLLPVKTEADAYSSTNFGRFYLLGKEAKWTKNVNSFAYPFYWRAILYQHCLVPRDATTMCPFTPIEMGGDGSFVHSGAFLKDIVRIHSSNADETIWRMHQMMSHKWTRKLVRTEKTNGVLHKHHVMAPTLEELRALLPSEALIIPKDLNHSHLLNSFKTRTILDPSTFFFMLVKDQYWKHIFLGKGVPKLKIDADRDFKPSGKSSPYVNFQSFIEQWMNPGFKPGDDISYFVDASKVSVGNPCLLPIYWESRSTTDLLGQTIADAGEQVILDYLRYGHIRGERLPYSYESKLHLWLESDSYVKSVFRHEGVIQKWIILVSKDKRLGLDFRRLASVYGDTRILMAHPKYWWAGRMGEVENLVDGPYLVIEDPGAIYWSRINDMWNFSVFIDGVEYDNRLDWKISMKPCGARFTGLYETVNGEMDPQF